MAKVKFIYDIKTVEEIEKKILKCLKHKPEEELKKDFYYDWNKRIKDSLVTSGFVFENEEEVYQSDFFDKTTKDV
jgi:hypothetical protein